MINIRTIRKMQDGDTLNIKNGKIKRYKGGYQINTCTIPFNTPEETIFWARVQNKVSGNCSIQFKNGKYYLSDTKHAYTKPQAKELAEKYNRSIVYEWKNLAHMAI